MGGDGGDDEGLSGDGGVGAGGWELGRGALRWLVRYQKQVPGVED